MKRSFHLVDVVARYSLQGLHIQISAESNVIYFWCFSSFQRQHDEFNLPLDSAHPSPRGTKASERKTCWMQKSTLDTLNHMNMILVCCEACVRSYVDCRARRRATMGKSRAHGCLTTRRDNKVIDKVEKMKRTPPPSSSSSTTAKYQIRP